MHLNLYIRHFVTYYNTITAEMARAGTTRGRVGRADSYRRKILMEFIFS